MSSTPAPLNAAYIDLMTGLPIGGGAAAAGPAEPGFLTRLGRYLDVMPSPASVTRGVLSGMSQDGQAMADAAYSGFTLPRDVYQGKVDLGSDEGFGRVMDLAGMAGGGGFVSPKPAGAIGMFGGRKAITADRGALRQAEEMAAKGADRQTIWDQTGWFQGPDQKWRFEISDDASKIHSKAYDELTQGGNYGATQRSAPGVLTHDRLYAAYPEARQVDVDARYNSGLSNEFAGGSFGAKIGSPRPQIKMSLNATAGPDGPRSIMLHELQHGLQEVEGFARGANPERATGLSRDEQFDLARRAYENSAGDSAILRELGFDAADTAQVPWSELSPRQQVEWLARGRGYGYHHSAGEVEARNVQARRRMTPEERREKPPWLTEDVPADQQIVRFR